MTTPTSPDLTPEPSGIVADVAATGETAAVADVSQLPSGVTTYPLFPVDPSKIGDFWPAARLATTESGVAYLAYEDNGTDPVMLILLSQGASEDPAARDRLAGQVDRMDIDTVIARGGLQQDTGRLGSKFRSEADDPESAAAVQSPWVALAFDQTPRAVAEAKRILDEVDLSRLPQQGSPAGPDYRLHWTDRVSPGLTRVWPLPWPGRRERGGRLTVLASWLLMLLLAAIAVLIAILIFSQAPPTPPPPPIPPTAQETATGSPPPTSQTTSPETGSPPPTEQTTSSETSSPPPTSGSPSPTSGSPSPTSGSPSPTTGSPSPTTGSPSPTRGSPSPGESGPGQAPSTPSRL